MPRLTNAKGLMNQGDLRGVALQYRKCAVGLQQLKATDVLFANDINWEFKP